MKQMHQINADCFEITFYYKNINIISFANYRRDLQHYIVYIIHHSRLTTQESKHDKRSVKHIDYVIGLNTLLRITYVINLASSIKQN